MKKIIVSFLLILSFSSYTFSQNDLIENNTSPSNEVAVSKKKKTKESLKYGAFLGRSALGFNFYPAIYTGALNLSLNYILPAAAKSQSDSLTSVHSKSSGYGMIFSYEFAPVSFMSLAVEIGFSFSKIKLNDNSFGKIDISYNTIPFVVGVRFYTGKRAPYGFFLYPKFGLTYLNLKGSYNIDAGETLSGDLNVKSTGLYAALEIGWRIQLFPKTGANWKVQPAIDISLLDIGYYFKPWANKIIDEVLAYNDLPILHQIKPFTSIRFILLPRIGFTIRF